MTRLGLAVYLALAFLVALVSAKVRVPVSYFWEFSHPYVDGYWEQLYRLRDKSGATSELPVNWTECRKT